MVEFIVGLCRDKRGIKSRPPHKINFTSEPPTHWRGHKHSIITLGEFLVSLLYCRHSAAPVSGFMKPASSYDQVVGAWLYVIAAGPGNGKTTAVN